jgi:DNA-binding transcriptional MocR family regulator
VATKASPEAATASAQAATRSAEGSPASRPLPPPGWSFRPPPGGLSLWLRHRDLTGQELAARAAARGLLISPGERFAADRTLVHHLRLPFTAGPEVLTQAAGILGSAVSGP